MPDLAVRFALVALAMEREPNGIALLLAMPRTLGDTVAMVELVSAVLVARCWRRGFTANGPDSGHLIP